MNYLLLTPDTAGSTILQRFITIALHLEGNQIINTHDINGDSIAIKDFSIDSIQNLNQIINELNKVCKETVLVSRLAKYTMDKRKDNASDQKEFYSFLNSFYGKKIMCIRENIFEYAMSLSIRNKSGINNIYTKEDRKKVLQVSHVDEDYFLQKCKEYVDYKSWVESNFSNITIVSYEKLLNDCDSVIEKITGYPKTFENNFGMPLKSIMKNEYNFSNSLINNTKLEISKKEKKALIKYKQTIKYLIDKKVMLRTPIKNTTLKDKMIQIKNFDKCLNKFYGFAKNHNWIDQSKATYDFWIDKQIC